MEKVKQIHLHENIPLLELSELRKSCNWELKGWNKIYITKKNREAKQCSPVLFYLKGLSSPLSFYFTNPNHPCTWFYFTLGFILTLHHLKYCRETETVKIDERALQNWSLGMQQQTIPCRSTKLGFQIYNPIDNLMDLRKRSWIQFRNA